MPIKKPPKFSEAFLAFQPSYFLWHLLQLAGSFDLKAFSPLWHIPQFLPAFISAMVIVAAFFIWKILGWQSLHFEPLSACILPSNMTLPADPPVYSTVFPEDTVKALPPIASVTSRTKTNPVKRTSSPPFIAKSSRLAYRPSSPQPHSQRSRVTHPSICRDATAGMSLLLICKSSGFRASLYRLVIGRHPSFYDSPVSLASIGVLRDPSSLTGAGSARILQVGGYGKPSSHR